MAYEIWDVQTGNLVASFGHEADALSLVRDAVEAHGEPYARSLVLVREAEDGTTMTVAAAEQLLERVRAVTTNGTRIGPNRS